MRVICTAGHVDHGKSALVKALTGMEPDRFAEEQRRGLTIDLGYAWTQLEDPDGDGTSQAVAFVDVPGHERFISNMLAGAGAVELALLVVAADEGWMAQSQEHLEILDLLGVAHGVAAISKSDLVEAPQAQAIAEQVRRRLAGTSLAGFEIVIVSAETGEGQEALRAALRRVARTAPEPADDARPRLWIDRVFTVRGAGTVVTGTLSGGWLRTGDEVHVLPKRLVGRVRGLQSLGEPVSAAGPGSRVAVNLAGPDRREIQRGHALGLAEQWPAAAAFDARIRPLPGREIGQRGDWHLHVGSSEHRARILPLEGQSLRSDAVGGSEEGFARVELDRPVPLCAGDAFVLRDAGRRATAGGGMVVDPIPRPRPRGRAARSRRRAELEARTAALDGGDRSLLLALHVRERGAARIDAAAAAAGISAPRAAAAASQQGLLRIGELIADRDAEQRWAHAAITAVRGYHREHPLRRAAPKDVPARAALDAGCPLPLAGGLLGMLVSRGLLTVDDAGLRTPDHQVRLDPAQARARGALLDGLNSAPFAPPGLAAAARQADAPPELVRELEAAGTIVILGPDLAVTADAVEAAAAALREAYRAEGPLTASRAKDVLGTSRKYALPLLEELDRRGVTRRQGDIRTVLG